MYLQTSYHQLLDKTQSWLEHIVFLLPNIAAAIVLLVLFVFLAKHIARLLFKILGRFSHNVNVNRILRAVTQFAIVVVGIFIALSILKLDKALSSLLAGAGIIGVALSFAFQDTAANFMGGIIIAVRRPFSVGDLVESKGYMGRIEAISMRTTKLVTLAGQLVTLPNREVLQNPLVNYSYTGRRRVEIELRFTFHTDLEKAKEVTLAAIKDIPFLNPEREVELFYQDIGDGYFKALLRFWINAFFQKDYLAARSQAIMNIQKAYDANGIKIPFAARVVFSQPNIPSITGFGEGPVEIPDPQANGQQNGQHTEKNKYAPENFPPPSPESSGPGAPQA